MKRRSGQLLDLQINFHAFLSTDYFAVRANLWLSMYTIYTKSVMKRKKSLIPNGCHCGETNCTAYDPNILVSTRKLCIIDANR